MNSFELRAPRLERMTRAVTLESTDRTPIMAWIDAWAATYRQGSMARLSTDPLYANQLILETVADFPELDMIEVSAALPRNVAAATLSKVKVAGKELPEGSLWQVDEQEYLTDEDYDRILQIGWKAWKFEYYGRVLGFTPQDFEELGKLGAIIGQRTFEAGIPTLSDVFPNIPLDPLAGARTMAKFMTDLYRIPDKLKAVMDVMVVDTIEEMRGMIRTIKPFSVLMAVARGSSAFLSPRLWNKFVWPYLLQLSHAAVEEGVFVNLHLDGDWNRDMERFKEMPRGKCIWACDNGSDIFKLKSTLDGHMAIKGDVPPALLALGTPDDVHAYCVRLIREIGPTGFILAPGCTMPQNAKAENVRAMIQAATGK